MDTVPPAFLEHLCSVLYSKGLRSAQELSGHYRIIASYAYQNRASYASHVEGGIEKRMYLKYQGSRRVVNTHEEIEAVPKKFVHNVTINSNGSPMGRASYEIVKRFPYSLHHVIFHSSAISEAWVDFAWSLRTLGIVSIRKKLEDDAVRLFQKLVDGRKLFRLEIKEQACEGGTLEIVKSVLCQDQFEELRIKGYHKRWVSTVVGDLLQFWSENSEKVRGRHIGVEHNCEGGIDQLKEFVLQRAAKRAQTVSGFHEALKICTKEECDFIDREFYNNFLVYRKSPLVYKFEDAEEGEQRRIYIAFNVGNAEPLHQATVFCITFA
uniref:F-box domain-containing protein n=1 Tax=Steinernema glaseri TaxID=37863 RepID=A0A1I8ATL2_9BILA